MHLLNSVDSVKNRVILITAYAAGLLISVASHLKVTDINSQLMMMLLLRVDQGKGSRIVTSYYPRLLEVLLTTGKFYTQRYGYFLVTLIGQPIIWCAVELAYHKAHRASGIARSAISVTCFASKPS